MANLDFFAARNDQKAILEFIFDSTDAQVFESYSDFGKELRQFESFADVDSVYPVGTDPNGNGAAILLQLWSPSMTTEANIRRISLDPAKTNGHTFRFCIEGFGLIQLYLGGIHEQVITHSHFGHFEEKGALKWGHQSGVNWDALKKLSNKICYNIRSRLGVAKVPGRPVLAEALSFVQSGYVLKDAAQTPWQYELVQDQRGVKP